ncbi:hypothetical protein TNCV_3012511 [Trichonephila clavipes]|nr:hypothetical protein TNCV_3012511 [Trichonephila clavipes]
MSSGRSLPQINLGVQGGIQGDSHKLPVFRWKRYEHQRGKEETPQWKTDPTICVLLGVAQRSREECQCASFDSRVVERGRVKSIRGCCAMRGRSSKGEWKLLSNRDVIETIGDRFEWEFFQCWEACSVITVEKGEVVLLAMRIVPRY